MALAPLATTDDLAARNIVVPAGVDADSVLDAVSDAIRDAAGVSITQATSTVALPVSDRTMQYLALPGAPVVSVSTVTIGGVAVTDYVKVGNDLYRACGWTTQPNQPWFTSTPGEVTVIYTHGYPSVPADIVDLACSFASLVFTASEGNYGLQSRTQAERVGDYEIAFDRPAAGVGVKSPSPVDIPVGTRAWLRNRFSGSAAVVR